MGSRNAERRPKASCSFEYPPSESELPQGGGYSGDVFGIIFVFSGTVQADSGEQDMTLQGNRRTKCESFKADDTVAEVRAHARAPLCISAQASHSLVRDRREAVSFSGQNV